MCRLGVAQLLPDLPRVQEPRRTRVLVERRPRLAASWALLWCLLLALPAAADPEPRRPNLLLLIADDVGWVDVGTGRTNFGRGSKYHETPNLERLAAEGMSFSAAYSQQSCMPTRASLLTGQYVTRHGVYNVGGLEYPPVPKRLNPRVAPPPVHGNDIRPEAITLAEALGAAGYRSIIIGKEHGTGPRRQLTRGHGFDVDLSVKKVQSLRRDGKRQRRFYFATRSTSGKWRFAHSAYDAYADPYTQEYVDKNLLAVANGNDPNTLISSPKHITDAIADATVAEIARSAARPEPWFAMVGFHAVHKPILPRADLLAKYQARGRSDLRHHSAKFAALLEGLDQSVARIVAALDDPNGDGDPSDSIAKQTLVIFISDNGGLRGATSNAPLRSGKGSFFEGGVRVPMIARQPGTIAAASHSNEPVHVIDFYPTFTELAGAATATDAGHQLDGESFASILRGEGSSLARPALYWHLPGYVDTRLAPSSVINRRYEGQRYKMTWSYEREEYSLYNLTSDLGETTNLLAGNVTSEHRATAQLLSHDLRRWVMRSAGPLGKLRATRQPVQPPPLFGAAK